jgi:hypothetical protein
MSPYPIPAVILPAQRSSAKLYAELAERIGARPPVTAVWSIYAVSCNHVGPGASISGRARRVRLPKGLAHVGTHPRLSNLLCCVAIRCMRFRVLLPAKRTTSGAVSEKVPRQPAWLSYLANSTFTARCLLVSVRGCGSPFGPLPASPPAVQPGGRRPAGVLPRPGFPPPRAATASSGASRNRRPCRRKSSRSSWSRPSSTPGVRLAGRSP